MTAPLRSNDPIVVDVALGNRAYDIVIGRDVLARLGEPFDHHASRSRESTALIS